MASFSAVYFDGRFVDPRGNEARVSVTDPGYLLGEGVFATLRGYDGVCFRPHRHFDHLARGAAAFGMDLPVSLEELEEIANEAAARTGVSEAYVRVTLTLGLDDARPVLTVLSRPLNVPSADDYRHGIAATIVTPRRVPPSCMDGTVKTTSYAPQVLAKREATSRGAAEGIMLAVDGALACGTMSNVFVVSGDRLYTPPIASGCRTGVTREAILELAGRAGLRACEMRLETSALREADEVFFTSTRIECLPVAMVDGRSIGLAPRAFPIATLLRRKLRALVAEERAWVEMRRRATAA